MSKLSLNVFVAGALMAAGTLVMAGSAQAVIITDGDIKLGVGSFGQLNVAPGAGETGTINVAGGRTGIAYNFGGGYQDATSPGCECEGFGLSATYLGNSHTGYANNSGGTSGLTAGVTSNVTATTVTVSTGIASLDSAGGLTIEQAYAPSVNAGGVLFENKVTITNNTSQTVSDLRYVRVMDWDVPLTEFNEFVTIAGTDTTADLELSHDNGFASSDPLAGSTGAAGTVNVDFEDNGPADHGAYFRFNFGELAAGESREFSVYYGAAGTEADILTALGDEGIELYSLGQSNTTSESASVGSPATFAFGFKGVGGEKILPSTIPEPGMLVIFGIGLLGLGYVRRKRAA